MTRLLDYIINHNKAFAGWTHYEKWEYREDVLEGMKEKAAYAGLFIYGAVALAGVLFLAGALGN